MILFYEYHCIFLIMNIMVFRIDSNQVQPIFSAEPFKRRFKVSSLINLQPQHSSIYIFIHGLSFLLFIFSKFENVSNCKLKNNWLHCSMPSKFSTVWFHSSKYQKSKTIKKCWFLLLKAIISFLSIEKQSLILFFFILKK